MKTEQEKNLVKAIERSISHDEIVALRVDGDALEYVQSEVDCDDYCDLREQYGYVDVWGSSDGNDWRIYVAGASDAKR